MLTEPDAPEGILTLEEPRDTEKSGLGGGITSSRIEDRTIV